MTWRKWLVRGLVFAVLGGGVLAFLLYNFWTSPATIRRRVLAKLAERFPGATVSLDAARLRLFGGIAVSDLRMARHDDLDKADFLYVPAAVLYHDKEQLLEGVLTLRKIEVFQPRLRVVRERDGRLNLAGLMAPGDSREPLATLVIQNGTILFEDRAAAPGTPLLEIKNVTLTAVNDPLPVLAVEGCGQTDVLGPVRLSARLRRDTGEATFDVALTALPFGPALVQRLAAVCPDTAAHLRQFRAGVELRANLAYRPAAVPPLAVDVTAKIHDGELTHARLPLSFEGIEGEFRLVNTPPPAPKNGPAPTADASTSGCGNLYVPAARLRARSGKTNFEGSLKDLCLPCSLLGTDGATCSLEALARELDWKAEHLPVTDGLFEKYPALKDYQRDYKPTGAATMACAFRQEGAGGWRKTWHVRPEGMTAEYIHFPYRVENVTGDIDCEHTSGGQVRCGVKLAGSASGRPIRVTGTTQGEGQGPFAVDFDIRGDNLPLDDKLGQALQGPSRTVFNEFHPAGLGDFRITIHRPAGAPRFANRFEIDVHDASFTYDQFPYRLDNVRGVLDVLPDHWEARDFRGTHGNGELRFSGRSYAPGAPADTVHPDVPMRVEVHGQSVPLDRPFEEALAPPEMPSRKTLKQAWQTMALSGQMSFDAVVLDRSGDGSNLDVTVAVRGCSMQPEFFKYALTDVGGTVHYTPGSVTIDQVEARHGAALLRLNRAQVFPKPGGGFQTRVGVPEKPGTGLRVTAMTADADLLRALPEGLRGGVEAVNLRGPFDVTAEMVIDLPDDGSPEIWWDGSMVARDAALDAGVELTGIQGQASCCGLYRNHKLRAAVGNAWFTEAALLGQPFHHLHGRFAVLENSPDQLRIYDLGAELFGGQLGGQARIDFTAVPRFELNLIGLQVKLEQFGRYNRLGPGAELQGAAELSLFLKGEVGELSTLSGNGRLDVPNGKLYRLPPLLDLLKALGLRAPDRTAFERARLEFAVEGPRVTVSALDLLGTAISLRGHGTARIDGSDLNLDFSADPGMMTQILPPLVSDFERAVSDQLLRIKVRGKLTEPRFEKELVPGVVTPVKQLLGTGD